MAEMKWHKPQQADRWTINWYHKGDTGGYSGAMQTTEWEGLLIQWEDQNRDKIIVSAKGKRGGE